MDTRRSTILRRLLQAILAAIAAVALVTGGWGLVGTLSQGGYDVHVNPSSTGNLMLDSNMRYFSGLWMGIGIALIAVLGSIERQVTVLRAVSVAVFLGGVGRFLSMVQVGTPSAPYVAFTAAELAFPLLLLLQRTLRTTEDADTER
jgi:hypothetical protein